MASVAAHCVLVACGAWLWSSRSLPSAHPPSLEIAVETVTGNELPGGSAQHAETVIPIDRPAPAQEPESGATRVARPDTGTRGRGGSVHGEPATNLASSIDPLTLERDPLNHLRASEVQRLATARARRTLDDRRATPHPMELSFVVSGRGRTALRRPLAANDPGTGIRTAEPALAPGGVPGTPNLAGGEGTNGGTPGSVARSRSGVPLRSPTSDQHVSASVILARPWVPATRAAVPAAERDRPSDTVDSRQRVASRVMALMQASTLGGDAASGPGGDAASAPAAAGGGVAQGAQARAAGAGSGNGEDHDDPELQDFYRSVLATLGPALSETFPLWAIADGRAGLVVFELSLRSSGQVASVSVIRPSGIAEYDRNVTEAVRQIRNFRQVPHALGAGAVLRIAWDSRNPAVGRHGPGPGQVAN